VNGRRLTVAQLLPELNVGGVERGTVQVAHALVAAGHRALVVSAGGRLVAELEECGAEHHVLPIGAKRLATLRLVQPLARYLEQEGVDIVHARSRLPAWIGRFALARITRARRPRSVTTVHGPYTVNRYSAVMVSGERVIAISDFIRDYALGSYPTLDAGRLTVIPRGVERARFFHGYRPDAAWCERFAREFPRAVGRALLTLPGRLTRWKGQLDFIELVARLRGAGHDVHGLLAGAAHPRKQAFENELRARIAALGLAEHLSLAGERSDLREILAVSHLVFSLTNEPEAFGRTTAEALSLGVPVVGYDHGGTAEILRTVYPVGLVPAGDVAAAVERSAALLAAAPPVPREHPYTVERMTAATLALYTGLASS